MVSYTTRQMTREATPGLNPCYSGRWSRTDGDIRHTAMSARVLILVIVEDGLVLAFTLMATDPTDAQSLNPCYSGRWSRTLQGIAKHFNDNVVLILIVVEDGLVLG